MRQCLYCQYESSDDHDDDCPQCGMSLPVGQALERQRRLQRFRWYCVMLAVFCLAMMLWLPR
ncbi:hypothetical protein PSm6_08520 [Pseudomonas solani]|uniref:Protein DnrP n=1 Tax=Pseudomonas solani TaxID=2731552 RepID=A0ABM7L4K1_9PSED|nr:hypothetical protein [Pseudomonas solani]EQM71670.1 hypothetical protein L682_29905 [Pseudomonas alcaligenes OT 69]MDN4148303.1 protein DnrP [Pseudomonas tohonis]BCD84445.1 hypothetical protein PSm6_08520 [Pseudomonas solani]